MGTGIKEFCGSIWLEYDSLILNIPVQAMIGTNAEGKELSHTQSLSFDRSLDLSTRDA